MKQLVITLGLAATVVGSLTFPTPAGAAEQVQFERIRTYSRPRGFTPDPHPPLNPLQTVFNKRAELVSQIAVFDKPHVVFNNGPDSFYSSTVWCYVANYGPRETGFFETRIKIEASDGLGGYPTMEQTVGMSLPPGAWLMFGFRVHAKRGVVRVTTQADCKGQVREYDENNNFDFTW